MEQTQEHSPVPSHEPETPSPSNPPRRDRGLRGVILLASAAIVVGIVLAVFLRLHKPIPAPDPTGPGTAFPIEGRTHVPEGSPILYQHYPPSSGPHYPIPQPWGVYRQEVPEGYWVHNLEHGGIVILYHCASACPDLEKQLADADTSFPRDHFGEVKLVIAPYAKLSTPLAIVSWGWVEELDHFDRAKLLAFYTAHLDHSPEDVP